MLHILNEEIKILRNCLTAYVSDLIFLLFCDKGMLLVCGGLVNGPYALITTAVSADLVSVCAHLL